MNISTRLRVSLGTKNFTTVASAIQLDLIIKFFRGYENDTLQLCRVLVGASPEFATHTRDWLISTIYYEVKLIHLLNYS